MLSCYLQSCYQRKYDFSSTRWKAGAFLDTPNFFLFFFPWTRRNSTTDEIERRLGESLVWSCLVLAMAQMKDVDFSPHRFLYLQYGFSAPDRIVSGKSETPRRFWNSAREVEIQRRILNLAWQLKFSSGSEIRHQNWNSAHSLFSLWNDDGDMQTRTVTTGLNFTHRLDDPNRKGIKIPSDKIPALEGWNSASSNWE